MHNTNTNTSTETNTDISTDKKLDIRSHYELVGEFHDVYEQPHRDEPYEQCFDDQKLINFRFSLITEEYKELKEAIEMDNLIEVYDALCDLSYVTNGTGQSFGVKLDDEETLNKLSPCSAVKLTDPISAILTFKKDTLNEKINLLGDAIMNYKKSCDGKKFDELKDRLVNILVLTYEIGHMLGGKMDEMFREVHRSNMTKICLNETDAKESVEIYEKEGRSAAYKKKNEYYLIYDVNTTKILKNHKWETPKLSQFI